MRVYALIAIVLIAGCGGMQSTPARHAQAAQAQASVIFYGDSLTGLFKLSKFFPGEPYFNQGYAGLTAVSLNSGFALFVNTYRPHAVVILAGTNDLWNSGTADSVFQTLTTMYAQSKNDGIQFVICTIPPDARCELCLQSGDRGRERPAPRVCGNQPDPAGRLLFRPG